MMLQAVEAVTAAVDAWEDLEGELSSRFLAELAQLHPVSPFATKQKTTFYFCI